jgi:hypothetical protein
VSEPSLPVIHGTCRVFLTHDLFRYAGDSRSVGLFHYYLSGDDRLMRQTIVGFAASITPDGLTQSRYPSHVPQVIAGFSLFWVLEVCDHMLWFGDIKFVRPLLSLIDGVFEFYNAHVDDLGLISGLPKEVWQYVDWVNGWEATEDHPDKGVPTSGRKSNRHTYFSMLYAYTLQQAAQLLRHVGRTGLVAEYESRADDMVTAIRKHCYDGRYFTDSTADIATESAYTQHCQVFGVLCGAAEPSDSSRLLLEAFDASSTRTFGKCSYVMMFYAFRAFAKAGDETYNTLYASAWEPWRGMIRKNLSTWEEDDVRERSDCHAWGSVAVYEYCAEVAGLQPIEPGWRKVLFAPRLSLSDDIHAKVALGQRWIGKRTGRGRSRYCSSWRDRWRLWFGCPAESFKRKEWSQSSTCQRRRVLHMKWSAVSCFVRSDCGSSTLHQKRVYFTSTTTGRCGC